MRSFYPAFYKPLAMSRYPYPVTNKFEARIVTEPDFEPNLVEEGLYVNLDVVRGEEFRQGVFYSLAVEDDRLAYPTNDYLKIICSGHRGCGKTTELERLYSDLNHPDRYFSLFLSVEKKIEYGSFQPEDIFVWIILELVEAVEQHRIPTGTAQFEDLARQLLSNKTIETELKNTFQTELSGEASSEVGFFKWLRFKAIAKAVFASTNDTSTIIREEVRKNTLAVIQKINAALVAMRSAIQAKGLGQDILFIIDGSEKLKFEVYEYLFIRNASLLRTLAVNMIVAVPIDSYYRIELAPGINFPNRFIVPMIKLGEPSSEANKCFKQVIERRIAAATFFAEGVLDECVRYSGGCMRQLLIIVNNVIRKARGQQASLETAQAVIKGLGSEMYQLLTSQHVATLGKGEDTLKLGDAEVREMLFQLVLLKYNGHVKLNPLLEGFISI